jgi:hypothetical protein
MHRANKGAVHFEPLTSRLFKVPETGGRLVNFFFFVAFQFLNVSLPASGKKTSTCARLSAEVVPGKKKIAFEKEDGEMAANFVQLSTFASKSVRKVSSIFASYNA